MPKALSNVEGIRLEDLGEDIRFNAKDNVYICPETVDDKAIVAQVHKEVEEITKELGELESEEFDYFGLGFSRALGKLGKTPPEIKHIVPSEKMPKEPAQKLKPQKKTTNIDL